MRQLVTIIVVGILGVTAPGCGETEPLSFEPGGQTVAPPSADARCSTLCTVEAFGGDFGNVCNADSATRCVALCEARIGGLPPLCGTCLLEEAHFQPYDDITTTAGLVCEMDPGCQLSFSDEPGERCRVFNGRTRITSTASFCSGDQAGERAGFFEVYPLTPIDCEPSFRPVTECAGFCQS